MTILPKSRYLVLLGLSLLGCKDDPPCAPGNGRMCDVFSYPVKLLQEQPRFHFTDWQVTEGACPPPRCYGINCVGLVFDGLFFQQEVTGLQDASPPDTRCRYQVTSAEGPSFDVLLTLAGSSPFSMCCNSGARKFIAYSWSASANGVALDQDITGFRLGPPADAGVTLPDAVAQPNPDSPPDVPTDGPVDAPEDVSRDDGGPREVGVYLDGAAVDASADVWPAALPSRQSVRFTVESQRSGWVVTGADRCGALSIEHKEADGTWRSLVLGIPYQCGCECPGPMNMAGLQILSSRPTLTWDARELAVEREILKCPTTPGRTQDMPILRQFPQPVPPGHYRATVVVLDALPGQCSEPVDAGRPSCSSFCGDYRCNLQEYRACPGDRTAAAEFDLPESGDVEVRISLS